MAFSFDKLTTKSQEAISAAQSLAVKAENPEFTPVHLLAALLEERDGSVQAILKQGGKAFVLHIGSREFINRLHDMYKAVEGDHLPSGRGMRAIFADAGFSAIELDESDAHYYFSAIKQGGAS